MTEKEFNTNLLLPLEFSISTSKIASEKATNPLVKEFAGFELAEATALSTVLKDMGAMAPVMEEEMKALFQGLESTAAGSMFDRFYLDVQLKNHQVLREFTEDYLNDAPTADLDTEEVNGRYIASLIFPAIEAHLTMAERLLKESSTG